MKFTGIYKHGGDINYINIEARDLNQAIEILELDSNLDIPESAEILGVLRNNPRIRKTPYGHMTIKLYIDGRGKERD